MNESPKQDSNTVYIPPLSSCMFLPACNESPLYPHTVDSTQSASSHNEQGTETQHTSNDTNIYNNEYNYQNQVNNDAFTPQTFTNVLHNTADTVLPQPTPQYNDSTVSINNTTTQTQYNIQQFTTLQQQAFADLLSNHDHTVDAVYAEQCLTAAADGNATQQQVQYLLGILHLFLNKKQTKQHQQELQRYGAYNEHTQSSNIQHTPCTQPHTTINPPQYNTVMDTNDMVDTWSTDSEATRSNSGAYTPFHPTHYTQLPTSTTQVDVLQNEQSGGQYTLPQLHQDTTTQYTKNSNNTKHTGKRSNKRAGTPKPKRPQPLYMYYLADHIQQFKASNGDISKSALNKLAKEQFDTLSEVTKRQYEDKRAVDVQSYHKQMSQYTATHPTDTHATNTKHKSKKQRIQADTHDNTDTLGEFVSPELQALNNEADQLYRQVSASQQSTEPSQPLQSLTEYLNANTIDATQFIKPLQSSNNDAKSQIDVKQENIEPTLHHISSFHHSTQDSVPVDIDAVQCDIVQAGLDIQQRLLRRTPSHSIGSAHDLFVTNATIHDICNNKLHVTADELWYNTLIDASWKAPFMAAANMYQYGQQRANETDQDQLPL